MNKYALKKTPAIGSNDYLSVIEENDEAIKETTEELFKMLPPSIKVTDIQSAYLFVQKISNTCWQCAYRTWKDVHTKNFEMISITFTQEPSLKQCLYAMCLEVEKLK